MLILSFPLLHPFCLIDKSHRFTSSSLSLKILPHAFPSLYSLSFLFSCSPVYIKYAAKSHSIDLLYIDTPTQTHSPPSLTLCRSASHGVLFRNRHTQSPHALASLWIHHSSVYWNHHSEFSNYFSLQQQCYGFWFLCLFPQTLWITMQQYHYFTSKSCRQTNRKWPTGGWHWTIQGILSVNTWNHNEKNPTTQNLLGI